MKVSEVFVSNVHHALRAVTMPASERNIGQFLTGVIDGPGAGGCEGETAQHDDEDEDGEGTDREEDIPPRPKKRKRAAKAMSITKLHVGPYYMYHIIKLLSEKTFMDLIVCRNFLPPKFGWEM